MKAAIEPAQIMQGYNTEEEQLYSVEEVFDILDKEFVDFYGEYGRKIVNARRTEWNQDGWLNFELL